MSQGSIPYLPTNGDSEIIFREPFPRVYYEPIKTLYIRVVVGGSPEQEYRTRARYWIEVMEKEIGIYGKVLNARAISKEGNPEFIKHSPQSDFFSLVDGDKGRQA